MAVGEVPGGDGDGNKQKKLSKAEKGKAERAAQVATDLDLKQRMVKALQDLAAASMPPPPPPDFVTKFKSVSDFLTLATIPPADRDIIMSNWPSVEDCAVLDAGDLTAKNVSAMAVKKFLYFRQRYK